MTKRKGSGKEDRERISLIRLMRMCPDDDKAREWFKAQLWPGGHRCPHCGSANVQYPTKHRTMTHCFRDRAGRVDFSVRTGTAMEGSKLGYHKWAFAIYLTMTGLKGVSSMKLHRDLGITQKSAWHLARRIRKPIESGTFPMFSGPAEADETCIGGKWANMSNTKWKELADTGCGPVGGSAVVGVKDRAAARRMSRTDAMSLQAFVHQHVQPDTTLYTNEAKAYEGMPEFDHEAVQHSAKEFVCGMAHSNRMESFWSMLKKNNQGIYHKLSEKHLDRYVAEFVGRHNVWEADTETQMETIARQTVGCRLRYRELVADNGLSSDARPVS